MDISISVHQVSVVAKLFSSRHRKKDATRIDRQLAAGVKNHGSFGFATKLT
jgi:hypothetical protein